MELVESDPGLDVDEVLARPLFAHLATASPGGPRESPVWFRWEDRALWIVGNEETDTFPARVERDPRVAVGIVDFDRESGRVHHVGVRGRASVEPFDRGRARRLLANYLGDDESAWDTRFRGVLEDPGPYVFVRVAPDSVVVRDQSYSA